VIEVRQFFCGPGFVFGDGCAIVQRTDHSLHKHAVSRGPKLDPRTDLASIPVLLFCLRIPAQGAERNPLDLPEPNYINTGNCEGCGQKGLFSQLFVGPPGRGLPEPTDFKTTASV
jgi:hypothetical protein